MHTKHSKPQYELVSVPATSSLDCVLQLYRLPGIQNLSYCPADFISWYLDYTDDCLRKILQAIMHFLLYLRKPDHILNVSGTGLY